MGGVQNLHGKQVYTKKFLLRGQEAGLLCP